MRAPVLSVLVVLLLALASIHCGSGSGAVDDAGAGSASDAAASPDASLDGGADATPDASRAPAEASTARCPTVVGELPGIPYERIVVTASATGDFNGDGKTDVAALGGFATGHGAGGVLVALGAGDGTFRVDQVDETAAGDMLWETNAAGLAAGDFDHDGLTDLVAADPISSQVTLVLGGADGGVGAQAYFATGAAPVGVAVGDMNGDGKLDVVTANENSGDVSVLLGDAKGSLAAPASYAAALDGGVPSAATLADFDGDHRLDVAVLDSPGTAAVVAVLLGADGGVLSAPRYTAVPGAASFATLDADGDGHVDLAIADQHTNAVDLLLGSGNGSFGAPSPTALGDVPGPLAVADMNGDGRPDLVVSCATGVEVLLNAGGGSFKAVPEVSVAAPAPVLSVADVNGDSRPDVVLAPQNAPLSVLLNEGGGALPPAAFVLYPSGPNPYALAAADLDGDGLVDLAVANGSSDTVSVLRNVDGGGFGAPVSFVESPDGGPPSNTIGPAAVSAVDLDGDGKRDLLVLDSAAGQVNVLLNQGAGAFGPPRPNGAGGTPTSAGDAMVTGDFNGDGVLDVAVADVFGPAGAIDGNVALLLGQGGGAFAPALLTGVGIQPGSLAAADLEGKGTLSLVVSSLNTLAVLTFDAKGSATVTPILQGMVGSPGSLAVADYDGDGKPDIALVLEGERSLDVLLGHGDGTFAAPTTLSLGGSFGDTLQAVDVDADGRLDLVAADLFSGLFVLHNEGGGSFAPPLLYAMGNGPRAVAIADFDGDGSLDFATANSGGGNASVLLSAACRGGGGDP